jgi:hypothetical protein
MGIEKVYENAEKLFQLGTRPIGVATYGLGGIEARSIGSYLREFEVRDPKGVVNGVSTVEEVVEALRGFFMGYYSSLLTPALEAELGQKSEDIPRESWPVLGLVVGGFSPKEYLSEVWNIEIPFHDQPGSATQARQQGNFGSNWYAMFEPIRRYTLGYDPALVDELMGYFTNLRGGQQFAPGEVDQVRQILGHYSYTIPFDAMPMQEGVEYTRWLVEMAINHHRYTIGSPTGAPVVGGEVRIGTVTYRGERFELLGN